MTDSSDTAPGGIQWKKRTTAEKSLMIVCVVFNVLFWVSLIAGAPIAIQTTMFGIWIATGVATYYLLGFFRYIPIKQP